MNRTIKDTTVRRHHADIHDQIQTHLDDFVTARNYACHLKTLGGNVNVDDGAPGNVERSAEGYSLAANLREPSLPSPNGADFEEGGGYDFVGVAIQSQVNLKS